MRGKGGLRSFNEYNRTHGAQINFGDLTPYLTNDIIFLHLGSEAEPTGSIVVSCYRSSGSVPIPRKISRPGHPRRKVSAPALNSAVPPPARLPRKISCPSPVPSSSFQVKCALRVFLRYIFTISTQTHCMQMIVFRDDNCATCSFTLNCTSKTYIPRQQKIHL